MTSIQPAKNNPSRKADWELDFYSRPIVDANGKKRWELLITTTQDLSGSEPFRWEKNCPAGEVNSIWLANSLEEAILEAKNQGWDTPSKLRCWRTSMKTMVNKAASKVGIEVVPSRRTYSLLDWLSFREKEVYPNEPGFLAGPLAPISSPILNQPEPLPEAARGDACCFSLLTVRELREAKDWPIEFNSLLPISKEIDQDILIPGLRLFSKRRALALSGWLGGLEPVKLSIEGNQLLLEAGQEDRWLVTDLSSETALEAKQTIKTSKEKADGFQFIAVQKTPSDEFFAGFWMMRDLDN